MKTKNVQLQPFAMTDVYKRIANYFTKLVESGVVSVKFRHLRKKSPQDRAKLKTGLYLQRSILNFLPIKLFWLADTTLFSLAV